MVVSKCFRGFHERTSNPGKANIDICFQGLFEIFRSKGYIKGVSWSVWTRCRLSRLFQGHFRGFRNVSGSFQGYFSEAQMVLEDFQGFSVSRNIRHLWGAQIITVGTPGVLGGIQRMFRGSQGILEGFGISHAFQGVS